MSGFTRLSESYSKMGTEGCEEFSLLMSSFLARMCAIIAKFGGDIDCFAGDALIVVFPADPTDALSNSTRNYRTGLSGHNSLAKSRTRSVLSSAGLPARRGSSIPSIAPQRHDVISTGIGEVASKGHSLQKLRSSSSGASLGPLTVHAGGSKMSRQGSVIRPQMDEAIDYAISCAMSISRELNGFQASKDDPPLGIHSALAAGLIYAVECGEIPP